MVNTGSMINNVFVFMGGIAGASIFPPLSLQINAGEIVQFTIQSIIGGLIALVVKVSAEYCIQRIKKRKKSTDGNK